MFILNDMVQIIDPMRCYESYQELADLLTLKHFRSGRSPISYCIGKVIKITTHPTHYERNLVAVQVRVEKELHDFIMGNNGVKLIERKSTRTSMEF